MFTFPLSTKYFDIIKIVHCQSEIIVDNEKKFINIQHCFQTTDITNESSDICCQYIINSKDS